MPVRLVLGRGHRGDVIYGADLLEGLRPGHVIADLTYDAEHFHDTIVNLGAEPVIPPRPRRRRKHSWDKTLYKERNLVERFFGKLKQVRRIATRYDKLLQNVMSFVTSATIHLLTR